jgi:hypothetical protein
MRLDIDKSQIKKTHEARSEKISDKLSLHTRKHIHTQLGGNHRANSSYPISSMVGVPAYVSNPRVSPD